VACTSTVVRVFTQGLHAAAALLEGPWRRCTSGAQGWTFTRRRCRSSRRHPRGPGGPPTSSARPPFGASASAYFSSMMAGRATLRRPSKPPRRRLTNVYDAAYTLRFLCNATRCMRTLSAPRLTGACPTARWTHSRTRASCHRVRRRPGNCVPIGARRAGTDCGLRAQERTIG
jgi:hypothetical protein